MQKAISLILISILLLCFAAIAENGTCEIPFNGEVLHLTYENAEIVDGQLQLYISGFGNTVLMRNNSFVLAAHAVVMIDGNEITPIKINADGSGLYTFTYNIAQMPEAVLLIPDEDKAARVPIWSADDATP